ncbi:DUF493 domain-containing protein [bacterium]|nr:DUF493 domain-containing protein [bacterium]
MQDYVKFKELLDDKYTFPCNYNFKFVVPTVQREELTERFGEVKITEKQSKTGKYTSLTIIKKVVDSDDVIASYRSCEEIKNLIML